VPRADRVDEQVFEDLWRRLGLSVDWSLLYTTIGDPTRQRVSQRRSCATSPAARPTSRGAQPVGRDFQTAVARPSWRTARRTPAPTTASPSTAPTAAATSSSTPPAPSCSQLRRLVAHPDDERYQPLFGTTVTTPVFGVEVPVLAHPLAEPDKGTGIAMICTFGDLTDVTWWRELNLPTRAVIGATAASRPRPPSG
jgi:valyl-tRNA synthetase